MVRRTHEDTLQVPAFLPSFLKISVGILLEPGTLLFFIEFKVWAKAMGHASADCRLHMISLSIVEGFLDWIPQELMGEILCLPEGCKKCFYGM